MRTLVAYYSRTGTTKILAEALAKALEADIDEIIDQKSRRGKLGYMRAARDAKGEKLTEIKVKRNPEDYGLVLIGTPIWWGSLTPAVRTYLKQFSWKDRTLAFFITSGGEDRTLVFEQMQELVEGSQVLGTFGLTTEQVKAGDFEAQLTDFLQKVKS